MGTYIAIVTDNIECAPGEYARWQVYMKRMPKDPSEEYAQK
jgi:hypothetical protein